MASGRGQWAIPRFGLEDIVAAIQDLGPNTDKQVLNSLVLHVSDTIVHVLRHTVGTNYRNRGDDIITSAHGELVIAMFEPQSADGKGLRAAFVPRVQFRAADAIRAEQKDQTRSPARGHLAPGRSTAAAGSRPRQELDELMDVDQILSRVTDSASGLPSGFTWTITRSSPNGARRSPRYWASAPGPPDSGSKRFARSCARPWEKCHDRPRRDPFCLSSDMRGPDRRADPRLG